jgi:hypothetical protein
LRFLGCKAEDARQTDKGVALSRRNGSVVTPRWRAVYFVSDYGLRDLRKARSPENVITLEARFGNVEDIAFWVQFNVFLNIELPD